MMFHQQLHNPESRGWARPKSTHSTMLAKQSLRERTLHRVLGAQEWTAKKGSPPELTHWHEDRPGPNM